MKGLESKGILMLGAVTLLILFKDVRVLRKLNSMRRYSVPIDIPQIAGHWILGRGARVLQVFVAATMVVFKELLDFILVLYKVLVLPDCLFTWIYPILLHTATVLAGVFIVIAVISLAVTGRWLLFHVLIFIIRVRVNLLPQLSLFLCLFLDFDDVDLILQLLNPTNFR